MHLGNGAITPECAMITAGIAAIGLGFATASACKQNVEHALWMKAGAYGAAVFAAQMINVPLLPYSSGHLVGGVLLAVALGPGLGALTMAVVLALQALLLGDGGLAAIGANMTNMALVPAGIVAIGRRWQVKRIVSPVSVGVMAALSVVLAAGLIVLEVAVFRRASDSPISAFALEMLQAHLVIGAVEGLLTGAIVFAAARVAVSSKRFAAAASMAALALVACAPLSSPLPDGYEASAERSGWNVLLNEGIMHSASSLLSDVQAQAVSSVASALPSEWLIALLATVLAGAFCAVIAIALRPQPRCV